MRCGFAGGFSQESPLLPNPRKYSTPNTLAELREVNRHFYVDVKQTRPEIFFASLRHGNSQVFLSPELNRPNPADGKGSTAADARAALEIKLRGQEVGGVRLSDTFSLSA